MNNRNETPRANTATEKLPAWRKAVAIGTLSALALTGCAVNNPESPRDPSPGVSAESNEAAEVPHDIYQQGQPGVNQSEGEPTPIANNDPNLGPTQEEMEQMTRDMEQANLVTGGAAYPELNDAANGSNNDQAEQSQK